MTHSKSTMKGSRSTNSNQC